MSWKLESRRILVHKGASGLWYLRRRDWWSLPNGCREFCAVPLPGGYTSQRTAFHAAVALTRDGYLWKTL